MKHSDIIRGLTLRQKARLCTGKGTWRMKGLPQHGLPALTMTDGPSGLHPLRGITEKAVCAPSSSTVAGSWDTEVAAAVGELIGEEALRQQISIVLGPGVNMKRSPLCGRNFEYYSEDPFLAGEMACAFVNGLQEKGVGASLKHFAANNQEENRRSIDVEVDERALREIYLSAFETVIKNAKPWTVMCAYNSLNGEFCSQNHWLLTQVLREEWGYEGILMTDWDACHDRVKGLLAGQDLTMPSRDSRRARQVEKAVKSGKVPEQVLDETVDRMLELMKRGKEHLRPNTHYSPKAHHAAVRGLAAQCAVLLKNENAILPLHAAEKIALIGHMAKTPRFQGDGSAKVNPFAVDCAYDVLLENGVPFVYEQGYQMDGREDPGLLASACHAARHAEKVLLFLGLTDDLECEGRDRKNLSIAQNQIRVLEELAKVNPNIVVVFAGGSPVEMPWLPCAKALLSLGLGGEAGAGAAIDLLYGKGNPSGKLAETWPLFLHDTPCYTNFPGNGKTVQYREGILIGYRYYDKREKEVLFPFGYGLSYTTFQYKNLKFSTTKMREDEVLTVCFQVKNTGERDGAEIAQLYVSKEDSAILRAPKELKGFRKVFLKAGETKTIELTLERRAFAYYEVDAGKWKVEGGVYRIAAGASSRDLRLEKTLTVEES